jgi:disulfide bond formation protein DsbB
MDVTFLSDLMMFGTLLMQVAVLVGIVGLFLPHNTWSRFVAENALPLTFLVVFFSVFGSFYYSNILDFAPCKLCVYQRWIMISQLIVLGLAVVRGDKKILPYIGALSVSGMLIALFQVLILPSLNSSIICLPGEVSCLTDYVTGFGYITIPVMSLTVFALLVVLWFYEIRSQSVV